MKRALMAQCLTTRFRTYMETGKKLVQVVQPLQADLQMESQGTHRHGLILDKDHKQVRKS